MASYPTLRTVTSANRDTDTTTTKTVNRANPASTADGDLLLAFVPYGNETGIAVAPTQTGWTLLVAPFGGSSGWTAVYWRYWHTGDPTTWGMTLTKPTTGSIFWNWSLAGFSNVDQVNPFDSPPVFGTKSAGAATPVTLGTVNVASVTGVTIIGYWGGIAEGGGTYSAGGDGTATLDVGQPYVRLFSKQQTANSVGTGAGSMTVQSTTAQGSATQYVMLALRPVAAQQYQVGPTSAAGAPAAKVGGQYVINAAGVLAPVRPRDSSPRPTTSYLRGPNMFSRCKHLSDLYQIPQLNTRRAHKAMGDGFDLVLTYANYHGIESTVNHVPITVTASWEVVPTSTGSSTKNGTTIPITFGGATSVTIQPGQSVQCDPIPVQSRNGYVYYEDTYVTVSAGGYIPVQGLSPDSSLFETTDNTTTSDLTQSATLPSGNPAYGYSAVAISATPFSRSSVPNVCLSGDSILFGVGRTPCTSGYEQALTLAGIPHYSLAMSGEQAVQFGGQSGTQNENNGHRYRGRLIGGCTDFVTEYSSNDFNSSATTAQMQARILDMARLPLRTGGRYHITTTTPKTTSTDSWATVNNQTPAFTNETDRLNYNLWCRDGCPVLLSSVGGVGAATPAATGASGALYIRTSLYSGSGLVGAAGDSRHPITGVFDACAAVSAINGSSQEVWNPNALTADGWHPGDSGHNMIAAAFATYIASHFAAVA